MRRNEFARHTDSPRGTPRPTWVAALADVRDPGPDTGDGFRRPWSQASTNTLKLTAAGGLQILDAAGTVVWSSITSGTAASPAFQADGNLALYDTGGNPLWATGTTNS